MMTQSTSLKKRMNNFTTFQIEIQKFDQDQYLPQKQLKKKRKKNNDKNIKNSFECNKYKSSLWQLQQNISYINFLKKNIHFYEVDRHKRRLLKVNVLMSQDVKTRTPDQCRSHHQKMMKHHLSIESIVKHVLKLSNSQRNKKQKDNQINEDNEVTFKERDIFTSEISNDQLLNRNQINLNEQIQFAEIPNWEKMLSL